jgi:hypothetical protein
MWAVGNPVERPEGNDVNPSFPQIGRGFGKNSGAFIHGKR